MKTADQLKDELAEIERSIKALRTQRKLWLEQNAEFIKNCRLLAVEAGFNVAHEYPYPDNLHTIKRYYLDGISIDVILNCSGNFDSTQQTYNNWDSMSIKVDGFQVCYYKFYSLFPEKCDSQAYFVPGNWMQKIATKFDGVVIADLEKQVLEQRNELEKIKHILLIGETL